MKLVKILIAGTAAMLAVPLSAAASDWHRNSWQPTSGGGCDWHCQNGGGEATIVNGQINLGAVWSKVNADINVVTGDVNVGATAVGNTVEVITMQDTEVDNTQINKGEIGARVDAHADSVDGNVNLSATALCNSADVSTDPTVTAVNNSQLCGAADPMATVTGTVTNVTGGVGMTATAIGNQLTTDSNAAHFPVINSQQNNGGMYATVNATTANTGPVDLNATAVGNTAQIVHFNTGH